MKYFKNTLQFVFMFLIHLVLVFLFSLNLYIFYFVVLALITYFFNLYFRQVPLLMFIIYALSSVFILNTEVYEDLFFEISLYFGLVGKLYYIYDEVIYALSVFHILVFINLKKIENIWDIMLQESK